MLLGFNSSIVLPQKGGGKKKWLHPNLSFTDVLSVKGVFMGISSLKEKDRNKNLEIQDRITVMYHTYAFIYSDAAQINNICLFNYYF